MNISSSFNSIFLNEKVGVLLVGFGGGYERMRGRHVTGGWQSTLAARLAAGATAALVKVCRIV